MDQDFPGQIKFGCGQCKGCRLDYSREWATRIMHELKTSGKGAFITLTLDDQAVEQRNGSIQKRDWQLFAKKLRHQIGPFRYYAVGEYGREFGRPHYHACILGNDFKDKRYWRTTKIGGFPVWRSELLEAAWPHGQSEIGELNFKTAAYAARYVMSKRTGKSASNHYTYYDVRGNIVAQFQPEFALMSRRPGIGTSFIEKYHQETFRLDSTIVNGRETGVPRFYDRWLEKRDPAALESLKQRRQAKAEKHASNNTKARLRARAKVHDAKMRNYKRDLS